MTKKLWPRIVVALDALEEDGLLKRIRWRLVNVGDLVAHNIAVTGLRATTDVPMTSTPMTFRLEVQNLGTSASRGVRGWLEVGDPNGGPVVLARDGAALNRSAAAAFGPLRRLPLPAIPILEPGATVGGGVECTFAEGGG